MIRISLRSITPVDVIVVDEAHRLLIGRPWLTLAIDVATRVVVGFYVSMEAAMVLCFMQTVLPKEPWLKARALASACPVWGLPRALHADNGRTSSAQPCGGLLAGSRRCWLKRRS